MKLKTALLFLMVVTMVSCNKQNKSKEIASYAYSSDVKLNKTLEKKVGLWIETGKECYGILIMTDNNDIIRSARPIPAKVMHISSDAIKLKATKTITLVPKQGCSKSGIEKDDTWWEKEGDLFQTYDEAVTYCKELMTVGKEKNTHFTID